MASHRGMGLEKIPVTQLKPTTGCLPDDISEVHVFRVGIRTRVAGYRSANVFYIVWLDWLHELY